MTNKEMLAELITLKTSLQTAIEACNVLKDGGTFSLQNVAMEIGDGLKDDLETVTFYVTDLTKEANKNSPFK